MRRHINQGSRVNNDRSLLCSRTLILRCFYFTTNGYIVSFSPHISHRLMPAGSKVLSSLYHALWLHEATLTTSCRSLKTWYSLFSKYSNRSMLKPVNPNFHYWIYNQQACIPVGCVPSAGWQVCLLRGSAFWGGGLLSGKVASACPMALWEGRPPVIERNNCENITFKKLRFRAVIILGVEP